MPNEGGIFPSYFHPRREYTVEKNTLIEMFTADGKQVLSRHCSGNAQLPLNSLTNGVYLVKINESTYKIVKR